MKIIKIILWICFVFLILNVSVSAIELSVETTDSVDNPERIFKSGSDIYIRTVIRNTDSSMISSNLQGQIKEENGNLIENLPPQYISLAPNEQRIIKASWNSGNQAEWTSVSGFKFIGERFRVDAAFSGSTSSVDFYVDEFGVDKSFRTLTYYTAGYWWEDTLSKIKERVGNGENVRTAWTGEWTRTVDYAKSLGMNVFDIGMGWYSWGYDKEVLMNNV